MNESDLENELRTLRPAAASRGLEARIGRELEGCRQIVAMPQGEPCTPATVDAPQSPGVIARWMERLLWGGLGAAATALVMMSLRPHETHVVSRETVPWNVSSLQPVLTSEEDLGWRDEGVQFNAHGQPMLKLSRVAVERKAWADLENAGVVQVETPRQEVMWMPVPLH